jgi:hypothetical protein
MQQPHFKKEFFLHFGAIEILLVIVSLKFIVRDTCLTQDTVLFTAHQT